ncbi:MAG: hypothetical protein FJ138_12360 [Deltaproteobacteria bacterium]|nr:hypothetical protein [Deltaproteobacteria bacterium]
MREHALHVAALVLGHEGLKHKLRDADAAHVLYKKGQERRGLGRLWVPVGLRRRGRHQTHEEQAAERPERGARGRRRPGARGRAPERGRGRGRGRERERGGGHGGSFTDRR